MLRYALAMKKGNIPWPLIEGLLTKNDKDRAWLEKQLDVEKNVVTNWKARGIPKAYAGVLAPLLKTSADYLLGVPGSSQPEGKAQLAPVAQAPAEQIVSADELMRLNAFYLRCTPLVRETVMNLAESGALLNVDHWVKVAGDKG